MYAFRSIENRPDIGPTLVELTRSQAHAMVSRTLRERGFAYDRVDANRAHQWVRDGGHHETLLWVDGNRVRKA